MKHGIPTINGEPDPDKLYLRCLYHEFFWGPFADERELLTAILKLDEADPLWDYDTCQIVNGTQGMRERIEPHRKPAKDRMDEAILRQDQQLTTRDIR